MASGVSVSVKLRSLGVLGSVPSRTTLRIVKVVLGDKEFVLTGDDQ